MASLLLAAVLSAVSVYAIDRIERMTDGPAPADPSLLRVVFWSGYLVLGAFSWAIVAGQGRSAAGLLLLPVVVAVVLSLLYGFKRASIKAAARLRKERFARETAECLQALERDPRNAAAHARLAALYEENSDPERALEHGRRLLELEPSEKNRRRLEALEQLPRRVR